MEAEYTSRELFHFVGYGAPTDDERNYETLKKVLSSCCVSHPPHDNDWGAVSHTVNWDKSLTSEELVVPTITCYADIPFSSLSIHVEKYGKFGLSFPRELLVKYGARPVMYVPTRNDDWQSINGITLLRDIEAVYKGFQKYVYSKLGETNGTFSRSLGSEPSNETEAIKSLHSIFTKDFLSFIKPFDSELQREHPNNFYMEREWRKHGNLKFEPHQVCQIVVAKGYASDLKAQYPQFSASVVEI